MIDIAHSWLPLLAVLTSLIAVVPIVLTGEKNPDLRELWTFIAGFIKVVIVVTMLPGVLAGKQYNCELFPLIGNVALEFRVDGLGMLFALVASFLWIVTSCYSIGYMRSHDEPNQTRFFAFFAISLSATLGVAFSANLLTMYLFYEMLSLATVPLVTHNQNKEARTGGRTYLSHLLGASIALALPAMLFVYWKSGGNLDFDPKGIITGDLTKGESTILILMFMFGFAKAGLMPLHSWLPGAMVAPTPVSALLHAVAVVKVGVFCVIRIVTGVFGVDYFSQDGSVVTILGWVASFTILASSLIALSQDNLKRRLAFSTIGQLAYIVLGAVLFTRAGAVGAQLHIVTHAAGKITLFMCAGAIYVATGRKYVSQLNGIGKQMPWTMGAFCIGAFSVIGLPPFAGFVSKWHLVLGALDAHQMVFVFVLIISSILNIAYLVPPIWNAFFKNVYEQDDFDHTPIKEAPLMCVVPLIFTSCLCLLLFIFPQTFIDLAELTLKQLTP